MYQSNVTKIRRFLRDPNGSIWDDNILMNLWNAKQREFNRIHRLEQAVTVLRHPPHYQMSYTHDWEWEFTGHDKGRTYKFMKTSWQSDGFAYCHDWEGQALGLSTGSETVEGYCVSQPWEAYMVTTSNDLSPMWLPNDFHNVMFMAYDKDPVTFLSWKRLVSQDSSYKSYFGNPQHYTMKDDASQEFYLYPKPPVVWDDVENTADYGSVLHTDFTTESGELGAVIDATEAETTQDAGIAVDHIQVDDNVLLVYRQKSTEIKANTDEPVLPRFLQKYIEHDVLADAYKANTDGKIKSLARYWEWRKELDESILSSYKFKRLADRDLQLTSAAPLPRRQRGPRLPSTYPAV